MITDIHSNQIVQLQQELRAANTLIKHLLACSGGEITIPAEDFRTSILGGLEYRITKNDEGDTVVYLFAESE